MITLYFSPEASGEVESVGVVGDGELSCVSGGSSEETDFVFCVEGDAVSEAGEGSVAKDLEFFK